MIEHEYFEMFQDDSIDKQLIIETDGDFKIGNEDIFSESLELTESLCSEEQLTIGSCEASSFKLKVANIMSPLIGQKLTAKMQLDHRQDDFQIGEYKIYSDKPTADRKWRELVAYDKMYDIINSEVSDWYNELLPNADSTVTLKQFRDSFLKYFEIEQEDIELVNDSMIVERTISPSELSGKTVITAICEINGCFGKIARNGKFRYVYLVQNFSGLFPADDLFPSNDLYPREYITEGTVTNLVDSGKYISATYEDYKCASITKLQIRKEENDVGVILGDGDNCYVIEDNFLVYGKSSEELNVIANNILPKIIDCVYRPFTCEAKGNLCHETGDAIRLYTTYEIVESYILQRTLKGIQALRDSFTTEGVEEYTEKVNSVNKSIIELKGKTNVLTRTVEETQETIKNVESGLQSQITQTAGSLKSEIENTKDELQSSIEQTAEHLQTSFVETIDANTIGENLLRGTNTYQDFSGSQFENSQWGKSSFDNSKGTITQNKSTSTPLRAIEYVFHISASNGLVALKQRNVPVSKGETYTISCYAKGSGSLMIGRTLTSGSVKYNTFVLTNSWKRYNLTIELDELTKTIYFGANASNNASCEIDICGMKMERGDKVTDYASYSINNESQIAQTAKQIVMKVDSNGNIVQVSLLADAETGSTFKVSADNIDISANDLISFMTNGNINLTSKNITIASNNFNVDSEGNVQCKNMTAISLSGGAIDQINNIILNSQAMKTANEAITAARNAAQTAQNAANTAQSAAQTAQNAANTANNTANSANNTANSLRQNVNNIVNTDSQQNSWISQLSSQLRALGQPGIS